MRGAVTTRTKAALGLGTARHRRLSRRPSAGQRLVDVFAGPFGFRIHVMHRDEGGVGQPLVIHPSPDREAGLSPRSRSKDAYPPTRPKVKQRPGSPRGPPSAARKTQRNSPAPPTPVTRICKSLPRHLPNESDGPRTGQESTALDVIRAKHRCGRDIRVAGDCTYS